MPQLTDEQENEFFKQLGVFIAMTSIVEANFNRALRELLGVPEKLGRGLVGILSRPTLDSLCGTLMAVAELSDFSPEKTAFLKEICDQGKVLAKARNWVAHQALILDENGAAFSNAMTAKAADQVYNLPCTVEQLSGGIMLVGWIVGMLDVFMTGAWQQPENQERIEALRKSLPEKSSLPPHKEMFGNPKSRTPHKKGQKPQPPASPP